MMAVFTLVFSRLGQMPSGGAPYPLFAFAALVPWFFFSNSVNSGTMSLVTYRNIVTKTYFPREIVPLAQVGSRLVDLAAAAGLFAILLIYYNVQFTAWSALTPLFVGLLVLFTLGTTLATSAINVFYRDVSPGGADRPAAVAVSHAGGVSAVGGAGGIPAAVSAQPADRRR